MVLEMLKKTFCDGFGNAEENIVNNLSLRFNTNHAPVKLGLPKKRKA